MTAPWVEAQNVGAKGVVIHRVVLRVIPHRADRVAVVVAHGEGGGVGDGGSFSLGCQGAGLDAVRGADGGDGKRSILPLSKAICSGAVVVILIGGGGLVGAEAEGVGGGGCRCRAPWGDYRSTGLDWR